MGLLVPYHRQQSQERNFSGRPAAVWGTTLTASATPHTLGTKVALVASTAREYTRIRITFSESFTSATLTDSLVNIYIGAAAAEVVIIPNLLAGWATTVAQGPAPRTYEFPIRIPGGARLSADVQSVVVSKTVNIRVELFNEDMFAPVGSKVEALGALTASSRGTQVTPGTTAEGTFTTIATSGRRYIFLLPMMAGNTDVTATVGLLALDVGTGSALIPGLENFLVWVSSSEFFHNEEDRGRYCDIASGTALQARLQSHTTDAEAKSVVFYGVY